MKSIPKAYQPEQFEDKIYQNWEKSGYFRAEIVKGKKPFTIMMPPPNVTGRLHLGHAMFSTLEDIMARYHRLLGEPTLWLPGTDHAGIATQTVVDKALRNKGINKNELGREKFVEKVWEWKEEHGSAITHQLRKLGSSCDWSRERFTLDEGLNKAVNAAFVNLYNKGLIYRKDRVVNWCPKCHTAIADDEVEHKEEKGKLYWIKYGPFVLATARPETKLGDTAVAVHPSDKRYKDMVGKTYKIPGVLGEFDVVVVADMSVDPKFGSGAVKVTPAHSMVDYEIAQRHNIPLKKIIDENGRMMANTGKYAGMKTKDARVEIVKDMEKIGLIDHIEDYDHNIATCYRCGGTIEPIPSLQWFVKMGPLAQKAKKVVKSGEIEIIPKRFDKVYFHWMNNIRDWCISRQLWWGHRLPVWYRKEAITNSQFPISNKNPNDQMANGQINEKWQMENDKSNIYVGVEPPKDIENWEQDPDVLDTWFSSALWPFSTLGWPSSAKATDGKPGEISDYDYFYPTTVMETGYDILFFWVARMIMMGLELTGKIPFKTVYLHGLVRDEQNRKMSKSLGNVLDPLTIIDKFGTDALRMALIVGTTPGQDVALGETKIKGYRNFSNKIWNASRFVMLRVSGGDLSTGEIGEGKIKDLSIDEKQLTPADKSILKRHEEVKRSVTKKLDNFKFSQAGEELYEYFWHEFCDVYIEQAKTQLENSKLETRNSKQILNSNDQNNTNLSFRPLDIGEVGEILSKDPSTLVGMTKDGLGMTNRDEMANDEVSDNTKKILIKVLSETLLMLHPFVPFVTEAVWQELKNIDPSLSESIMISSWPKS